MSQSIPEIKVPSVHTSPCANDEREPNTGNTSLNSSRNKGAEIKRRMKNLYFRIILVFSGAVCISAQRNHELCLSFGCYENGNTRLSLTFDGDDVFYVDLKNEQLFWNSKIPHYDHIPQVYNNSKFILSECKKNVERWKPDKSATSKPKEPPEMIIYPRDEVVEDEESTLICFMNHFFPPTINIKWAKNGAEVTVEDAFIRSLPNPDGLYYVFSHLNFVPKEGDIYSCTVKHEALEEPQTKFWEVDKDEISNGPSLLCGLGLTLGLLGVAAGTFFFVKGNQYHSIT